MSAKTSRALPAHAGSDPRQSRPAIAPSTAAQSPYQENQHRGDQPFNHWPQILWIARADGDIEWFNQPWYDYMGAGCEQSVGSAWVASVHPDDRPALLARWQAAVAGGGPFEIDCRLRRGGDGEYRWHLARATPRRDATGRIEQWYGAFTDIHALTKGNLDAAAIAATNQTRLNQQARQAERQFARQLNFTRGITDSLAIGLYAVDLDGRATFVNPAAEGLLEWSAHDLLGKDVHEIIHFQHADHGTFPKEQCPLLAVLRTGQLVRVEDDVFTTKSGKLLPVAYSSAPVMEDEKIVGAVISFQDITGRKQSERMLLRYNEELENRVLERTLELRELNGRLQSSNRELQDFASVASHDLQEPLRKIQAFGDRLAARSAAALGEEGADYLKRMQNAAGRMQRLISDLLSFSRVTTKAQPFVPVNLQEVTGEVIVDLESALEKNGGKIEFGNLPVINADALQMRQLMQNLIGNALKFRKPGVPSVICVSARMTTSLNDGQASVEMCELVVADNGIGFDEKYLDRIFNVFQRLHARTEYEGTGIGLAVCRKIAERHGGSITATSRPGAGSTFIVILPVRQSAVSTAFKNEEPYAG